MSARSSISILRVPLALIYLVTVPGVALWATMSEETGRSSGARVDRVEFQEAQEQVAPPQNVPLAADELPNADLEFPESQPAPLTALSALVHSPALVAEPNRNVDIGSDERSPKIILKRAGESAAAGISQGSDARARDSIDFTEPLSHRPDFNEPLAAVPETVQAESGSKSSLAASGVQDVSGLEVPPPSRSLHNSMGAWAFLGGTFGAQVASKTLQVTLPLLLYQASSSWSSVGWALGATTFLDMAGTFVGGRLSDKFSAKAVLVGSSWIRTAAIGSLPILSAFGALSLWSVVGAMSVDAICRGAADTARSTISGALTGGEKGSLDKMMARFEAAFDLGSIAGPFMAAGLMMLGDAAAAQWIAPIAFGVISVIYMMIPPKSAMPAPAIHDASKDSKDKPTSAFADPWMRWALVAAVLLTLYPLQGLLPAMFAKDVLGSPSFASWLVGIFGIGSLLGDWLYTRLSPQWRAPHRWVAIAGLGALALGLGWLPGAFWLAAVSIAFFSMTNSLAWLALNSEIQSRVAGTNAGSATGWFSLASNATSALLRPAVGLLFVYSGGWGWYALAAGFGVFAVLQWAVSWPLASSTIAAPKLANLWRFVRRRLGWLVGSVLLGGIGFLMTRHGIVEPLAAAPMLVAGTMMAGAAPPTGTRPSPVHGLPGRLIVVEGLDGSGKSTQLEMLKESLESRGLKVIVTRWNSSELLSETVKRAKKERTLTPRTFAYFNAADLDLRMEKTILSALRDGAIVLSDRHFYTSLARDGVRGNDSAWLRNLYASTVRPDLTFYFKLPVKTAIQRVLGRAEAKLKLSEDFDEEEHDRVLGQNFYAVGRDMDFSKDDRENFAMFQQRVAASYDEQAVEFGFRVIDASKPREAQNRLIADEVLGMLGPLSAYQKSLPRAPSIFDKDPAQDSEQIRANYLHEKHGAHFYFRNMLEKMQERFEGMMDLQAMPKVFLHGSPHLANMAKTDRGVAMGDWDRSRFGPYAWDLLRHLVSLSFFQKKPVEDDLIDAKVAKQFRKGYLHGFRHPDRPFSEARILKDIEPKEHEISTNALLDSGKKWVAEMRSDPLPADDAAVVSLVNDYLRGRNEESLLEEFSIEEAGRGEGSMGMRDIYLIVLAPKDPASKKDRILLNFKQVRDDADRRWFKNPFSSNCERMLQAGQLYAPGWEERSGCARWGGVEYFVRQIPPQNVKVKGMLEKDEQKDVAYAVGTQLGRAHRLSLDDGNGAFHQNFTPQSLEEHLEDAFDELLAFGAIIKSEIEDAHQRYLARMKREGLVPGSSSNE